MAVWTIVTEEATSGDREGGRRKTGECDAMPMTPREEGVHEG